MPFKLSLSNIRRSLRDYAIYFFTLIIGVSVFYVFNAVGSQTAMLKLGDSTNDIVRLLDSSLSAVSVFVAGVLGLLIVYASRFLMKRRNKEFALYMMLGMGKRTISSILLLETVIIGISSLGIGLILGIGLSQLMSALVVNLFEADMSVYKFSISGEAIVKTIVYFSVMYIVVMLFNSIVITRMKLIDLLQSGKKSENIKLKNPWLCVLTFLLSAAMLGFAYYEVGWKYNDLNTKKILFCIILGSAATFLVFWSVSGMLLRVVMSIKGRYYRGLNCFTFRQLSSKVNTMVFSMTVICLMLFVTICTLSASFSIRNSMNYNLREFCPADYETEIQYDPEAKDGGYYTDLNSMYTDSGYDITEDFDSYVNFRSYGDPDFTFEDFLGSHLDETKQQYSFMQYDQAEQIVKVSDYNSLMELYGKKKISVNEGEYILLCNLKSMKQIRDAALKDSPEITVFGTKLKPRYSECQDGFIDISTEHINTGVFIVPDSAVAGKDGDIEYFIGNYASEDKEKAEKTVLDKYDQVLRASSEKMDIYYIVTMTKLEISAASIGLGAIITFLGLYIGLVFLIACGAILALKELSESVDSIMRYEMLRKIGADERDISKSLFRQTGIFFLLPLLLAVVHSIFGMKFAVQMLEIFGTEKMWFSIALTSVILLLIYGGYFAVTYFCSKGIIRDRKSAGR